MMDLYEGDDDAGNSGFYIFSSSINVRLTKYGAENGKKEEAFQLVVVTWSWFLCCLVDREFMFFFSC